MGMEKKTKIIVIVIVTLLVIGGIIGLILGLVLPIRYVELEVWPRSEEYNYDQPVIQFRSSDPGSWHVWYSRINDFLKVYETSVPEEPARAPCSPHNRREQHARSPACELAMRVWAPCTADEYYGYPMGKPCIFLRLNHIHYWIPEPYNATSNLGLPPDMPMFLKDIMHQRPAYQFGDYVWVTCGGEFSADEENIGPLQYILSPGFPLHRLHTYDRIPASSRSLPDQMPGPLVAVFFENPRRGVLINVECRIWTRDIYYDRTSRYGRTRFELYVD